MCYLPDTLYILFIERAENKARSRVGYVTNTSKSFSLSKPYGCAGHGE